MGCQNCRDQRCNCDRCRESDRCNCDRCNCDRCRECRRSRECREEPEIMTHVHEYESSTKLAEECDERHNHRVAGVTEEVMFIGGGNHVHRIINDNTDFFDHAHRICVTTGPAIDIPNTNKHVHKVSGTTTEADEHVHDFLFTTQINAPLV